MNAFFTGFEKKAEASKKELKEVLKKHEERETPEQEAMESKREQELERKAGLHEEHEKKAFWVGFEKRAEIKDSKDKDPSWWEKQKGVARAARQEGATGLSKLVASDELVGKRAKKGIAGTLKGLGIGGAVGAAGGALAGLAQKTKGPLDTGSLAAIGAVIGAAVGADIGHLHGVNKADKEYLKAKGITLKHLGLSSDFSPEAKAKYIDAYKK